MENQIKTIAYQNLYNHYDNYIKVRNYKVGKGKMYQTAVKEFLIWMERYGVVRIKEITSTEMRKYYEYLITRPNKRRGGTLAESTIKLHLFSIALFRDNLLSLREITIGFIIPDYVGEGRKPMNSLSVEEIKSLYLHTENLLEKALLSVAYGCGLRRSELQNLIMSDVQLSSGMMIVRKGKGGKRREVPMSDNVLGDLKRYVLEHRQPLLVQRQIETAFFVNRKGKRMSGETLNKTLKKIIGRTENQAIIDKDITLHCLRHSIAHHLSQNNAGLEFIRDFLGHSFINTSSLYAIKNKKQNKPIIII